MAADADKRETVDLDDLVASTDTGARSPKGWVGVLLLGGALFWSVFQIYYASPLPFTLTALTGLNFTLNDTEARAIHLALALFLGFMAYPMRKRSPRDRIPIQDWVFATAGAFCAAYIWFMYAALADRPGLPTTTDIVVSVIGLICLLEATRRALGPPLMIVALVFLAYVFFGDSSIIPDAIRWKGASLNKAMSHMWLTTEGVFGIALGVSTSFVFLFVLFGSLLDRAGAGNYFIQVAFAMLGHLRGGPAKAAVVSSGMTGLISGSSIANVVTTGTFTIPLMKRVGFTGEKAGAVEVASSVNGQIMPPVMGAAAFLMVEYVGISYVEVVKHAFLPAVISYIALVYIVHLEAMKTGMKALPKPGEPKTFTQGLLSGLTIILMIIILAGVVYFGVGWMKGAFGAAAFPILAVILGAVYVGLIWFAAQYPELAPDDPNAPVVELPRTGPTVKSGLHYLLPIVVLVWFLMVERKSPGLSAFYAVSTMIAILVTQRPLMAMFRKSGDVAAAVKTGFLDLYEGLIAGARNMIGIAIATATAGIVVGTVSLTGIGQVMAEFVEILSLGEVVLMLIWVAILSLVLGMGLPTTANYIVVSTLMAPVVVELGADSGLIVPLIAVHMFVFYFGIMADVTPPVGLASFAAAAVSGADPIRTGFTAFFYSLRTVALPFVFIFNPALLLIGLDHWTEYALTIAISTLAILIFAAATQGYFFARSRIHESIALLVAAFILFRPDFLWDRVFPPFEIAPGSEIEALVDKAPAGASLPIVVSGESFEGDQIRRTILLPIGDGATALERLEASGLILRFEEDGAAVVDDVGFGSPAEKLGVDFDFVVEEVKLDAERPAPEWIWLLALAIVGGVVSIQRRRKDELAPTTASA